ncbi:glycosyltransferase [Candidatus Thioglobus sp.]|nr:glycosyltransferase [Candidatus Thioglobus sp.]
MNILYTNFHPGNGGGHTTYLTYLFNNLSKLHSSSLNIFIAVPKNSKLNQDLKKKFSPRVFDVDFPAKPKNFFHILKNVKVFAKLIKQNQIDIVHTNGTPDHKIVMLSKWFYNFDYKIVRTKHDSLPIKQNWFTKNLYDKYTDHLIVVSNYQYKKLLNRKLQRKTTVIINGIDLQYYQPRAKSNELINKFGISKSDLVLVSIAGTYVHKGWQLLVEAVSKFDKESSDKIKIIIAGNYPAQDLVEKYDIIYSGNFSKWKGLEILIEAISIIKHKYHCNVNAVLIGSNEETKKHYGDLAKKLKVFSSITIVNRVEHKKIYDYISNSKIGVLSNKYDADGELFTSPLKLYEYLGAGLKVVVSKLPSIESNIDKSLVYYASPENSKSFAQAIIKALDDVNFDSEYVKDFAKQYTWKARAIKFKEFLNENFDN